MVMTLGEIEYMYICSTSWLSKSICNAFTMWKLFVVSEKFFISLCHVKYIYDRGRLVDVRSNVIYFVPSDSYYIVALYTHAPTFLNISKSTQAFNTIFTVDIVFIKQNTNLLLLKKEKLRTKWVFILFPSEFLDRCCEHWKQVAMNKLCFSMFLSITHYFHFQIVNFSPFSF